MVQGRGPEERLPWLDQVPRAAPPAPLAARRARTPLLLLLMLFVGSGVALLAFLAGRSSVLPSSTTTASTVIVAPVSSLAPAPTITTAPVSSAAPRPTPPAAAPAEVRPVAPAPAPQAARVDVEPRAPTVRPPRASKSAAARSARATRPSVRVSSGVRVHRNTPRARRYAWPSPDASRPSGRVVQLGAYHTRGEANAAWRRLRAAYPYLARLPRRVVTIGPSPGRPLYYRLRLGARSAQSARGLCVELHRRGRGCIVV